MYHDEKPDFASHMYFGIHDGRFGLRDEPVCDASSVACCAAALMLKFSPFCSKPL